MSMAHERRINILERQVKELQEQINILTEVIEDPSDDKISLGDRLKSAVGAGKDATTD